MTAVVQRQTQPAFAPLHVLSLVLGGLMLLAFLTLSWVNAPETGAVTANALTASRDANPLEVPIEGLVLLPIVGLAVVLIGLWTLFNPRHARTAALLTCVMGILSLVYYVVFATRLQGELGSFLPLMGAGFWVVLAVGVAMVGQLALPRPAVVDGEISRTLGNQEAVLALGLVALVAIVGVANPRFLAERNLSDILQGNAYIAVAALGMSMVIISGNIDISVGALIGVLAVVSGSLATNDFPIWLSWVAPLILGGVFGALIGFMIAYLRIPSIIVTLGMFSILKGGLIIATGGRVIEGLPSGFALAQMRPLGIPVPIIFMFVLTIIVMLFLRYTTTGRAIYAVGGNAEAARLSGISPRTIIMRVFILHGVIAGIAALLMATQFNVIQATVPPGLELSIITASVVGGVSILGGVGTVIGSTLATILLNAIRSAMIFINVSPFWLQAVQGFLILVTVLVDLLRRNRQMRAK